MKILLLWDIYPEALRSFYAAHPPAGSDHAEQSRRFVEDCFFGWTHFLVPRLRDMGHDARLIVGNAKPLQEAWARENGVDPDIDPLAIVAKQVAAFDPDLLWVTGVPRYLSSFLKNAVSDRCRTIAWIAYNAPSTLDLSRVDGILTSHDAFVTRYNSMGIRTLKLLPCFDPRILENLGPRTPTIEATFIGSITTDFFTRARLLSRISGNTPLTIFGNVPGWSRRFWRVREQAERLRLHFVLRNLDLNPPVFGPEMFRVLRSSKMVLNIHADSAKGMAGNMRMFETTGAGSLLITEDAPNVGEIFEPGREVVTYGSAGEAVEAIAYFADHDTERESIAAAGHERTIREHNPGKRAEEFLEAVGRLGGVRGRKPGGAG